MSLIDNTQVDFLLQWFMPSHIPAVIMVLCLVLVLIWWLARYSCIYMIIIDMEKI